MKKILITLFSLIWMTGCGVSNEGQTPEAIEATSQDIVTLEAYVDVANDLKSLEDQMEGLLVIVDDLQTTNNQLKDDNQEIKATMNLVSERLEYLNGIALEIDDYVSLQNALSSLQIQLNLLNEDVSSAIDTGVVEVAQKVLYVDNALDLINAIDSDCHIVLSEGEYNLTTVDLSRVLSPYLYVEEVYDGQQLSFSGLRNLTIEGAGIDQTVIMVEPRYADVFSFDNSSSIIFSNLTMGHTIEQGSCTGGVVRFNYVQDVTFENTRLYGCGTYGIVADSLFDMTFNNSIIDGCSYGIMQIHNSKDLTFTNSNFRDNATYDLVTLGGCQNVVMDHCIFENNFTDYDAMFMAYASMNIVVKDSVFIDNTAPALMTLNADIQFIDCDIADGQFAELVISN